MHGLDTIKRINNEAILRTTCLAAKSFTLICGDDKETANKYIKRFFDKVDGIDFPDDWDDLSEDEKSKRLKGVIDIGFEEK